MFLFPPHSSSGIWKKEKVYLLVPNVTAFAITALSRVTKTIKTTIVDNYIVNNCAITTLSNICVTLSPSKFYLWL